MRSFARSFGSVFKQILEYIHSTISELRRAPKPVVSAVDGVAAAGGLGLAMAADLVVCSDASVFEWAYGKTALTGAESSTFLTMCAASLALKVSSCSAFSTGNPRTWSATRRTFCADMRAFFNRAVTCMATPTSSSCGRPNDP